jgi:leucyl-tRNA synthetase
MFIGPFEKPIPWNDDGLVGSRRFLERIWRLSESIIEKNIDVSDPIAVSFINKAIQKVGNDIETFKFNTAISSMMICLNEIQKRDVSIADFKSYVSLLAPFAPHTAEEIWSIMGEKESIHISSWPKSEVKMNQDDKITLSIQINGKYRSKINVSKDIDEETLKDLVLKDENVKKHLLGQELKKFVYVPGRIVNIVF